MEEASAVHSHHHLRLRRRPNLCAKWQTPKVYPAHGADAGQSSERTHELLGVDDAAGIRAIDEEHLARCHGADRKDQGRWVGVV